MISGLGLDDTDYPQLPQEEWKATKEKFAEVFLTKTQSEWANIFDGTDACVTPVLDLEKAHLHPQNEQVSKINAMVQLEFFAMRIIQKCLSCTRDTCNIAIYH